MYSQNSIYCITVYNLLLQHQKRKKKHRFFLPSLTSSSFINLNTCPEILFPRQWKCCCCCHRYCRLHLKEESLLICCFIFGFSSITTVASTLQMLMILCHLHSETLNLSLALGTHVVSIFTGPILATIFSIYPVLSIYLLLRIYIFLATLDYFHTFNRNFNHCKSYILWRVCKVHEHNVSLIKKRKILYFFKISG